eukprot:scaffold70099_cov21-Prasinocladus_malaysianus.AAC.2
MRAFATCLSYVNALLSRPASRLALHWVLRWWRSSPGWLFRGQSLTVTSRGCLRCAPQVFTPNAPSEFRTHHPVVGSNQGPSTTCPFPPPVRVYRTLNLDGPRDAI